MTALIFDGAGRNIAVTVAVLTAAAVAVRVALRFARRQSGPLVHIRPLVLIAAVLVPLQLALMTETVWQTPEGLAAVAVAMAVWLLLGIGARIAQLRRGRGSVVRNAMLAKIPRHQWELVIRGFAGRARDSARDEWDGVHRESPRE